MNEAELENAIKIVRQNGYIVTKVDKKNGRSC